MSASNFPPNTPPTGSSSNSTGNINEGPFTFIQTLRIANTLRYAQSLRDARNGIRHRFNSSAVEPLPYLDPLLPPTPGDSAQDLRSHGGSTIGGRTVREELNALIQDLSEASALTEPLLEAAQRVEELIGLEESEGGEEADQQEQEQAPNQSDGRPEETSRSSAPSEPTNSHPVHAFISVSDLPDDERSCCICRVDFFDPDRHTSNRELCIAIKLQCGHVVGDRCIRLWVDDSLKRGLDGTCPMCRTIVFPGNFTSG